MDWAMGGTLIVIVALLAILLMESLIRIVKQEKNKYKDTNIEFPNGEISEVKKQYPSMENDEIFFKKEYYRIRTKLLFYKDITEEERLLYNELVLIYGEHE